MTPSGSQLALIVDPPGWVIAALIFIPFAISLWTAVDAAIQPGWAFARAGKSKSLWIVAPVFGILLAPMTSLLDLLPAALSVVVLVIWIAKARPKVLAAAAEGPDWAK